MTDRQAPGGGGDRAQGPSSIRAYLVQRSVVAASQLGNVGGCRVHVGKLNSAPAESIDAEGPTPNIETPIQASTMATPEVDVPAGAKPN